MEIENEQALDDVMEQEDDTLVEETDFEDENQEETVTLTKDKFTKMKRKAIAYDKSKGTHIQAKPEASQTSDRKLQRLELRVEGYDDDSVDFILKNGGKKALENPFVKTALEAMKEKKIAEAAILGSEGEKSSVEKRFTKGDFAKLSHEDQLKALSELQ